LPSRRAALTRVVKELAAANPKLQVWRFGKKAEPATVDKPLGDVPQTESRLERGLFAAEAALSESGARRIVLLSDGRETDGDARRAARSLGDERIAVYPVRLPAATDPEVLLVDIRTPEGLRRGEQVELSLTVHATIATSAQVTLSESGRTVWDESVELKAGDNEVRASLTLQTTGYVRLHAEVSAEKDTLKENNVREQTVYVEGPPRVLVGTPSLDQTSALVDALTLQGIDVVRFDPSGVPQSLEELAGFDEVILDEIPPSRLDVDTQELFESFVRDLGGGLLFVTGHTGLGTPDDSLPLQRLLPLASEERIENQVPPVAMVLVLDRSGSMEGDKLAWTKRAALSAVEALPLDAQLGVIAFDAEFRWIAPLNVVSNRDQITEQINSLAPGGGTRFYPALEGAYYKLGESRAAVKHVVLLTDGLSTDGVDFKPLAKKMAQAGITLSTVAMSREADIPLLKQLAQISGGRFYETAKPTDVPRIFVDESRLATKRAQIERTFRPTTDAFFEPLSHTDFAAAPQLRGFVATTLRPGAEQVLSVEHKQPLLAHWRYGLGHVFAFVSDTDGIWARDWVKWSEYPRLWSAVVRSAMRDRSTSALLVDGRVVDDVLEVMVDVDEAKTRATKDLEIDLSAIDSSLVAQHIDLNVVGPGQFRGRLPWTADGAVVLRAKAQRHGQVIAANTRILERPFGKEFVLGDDDDALAAIASLSGGEVLQVPDVAKLSSLKATQRVPGAPWLLGLALLLFLLDLFIKRVRPTA
jgi:Mg-chelatase subunit ChlD